jgi:RNA polymerase sigma factor (sigma-70 family)
MSDSSLQTAQLHGWLARIQAGDLAARDELLRQTCARMERLARKMLRSFPHVRRWADTDDVLQSALLRLMRSLNEVRPASTRDYFGLAAEQIRRELLDLARHFYGPEGEGAHHASHAGTDSEGGPAPEPVAPADDPDDLDRWCAFHQQVEKLPVEEREVVGLIYYHGWKPAEVAELFQVSTRTVKRRWESALARLHQALRGRKPQE